ncbi:MAG TPA: DUF58 domain-containing protein [Bacteroidia bacterium]|nr:DUF58 domain-containing protein [Bacteroidia bacterium]
MKFKLPEIYFTSRCYTAVALLVFVYLLGFIHTFFYHAANILFLLLVITLAIDIITLFANKNGVRAKRISAVKLSNGDDNVISIHLENNYGFKIHAVVTDELPIQFQIRDFERKISLEGGKENFIRYSLRPVERGEYHFGALRVFVSSAVKLIERRFSFEQNAMLPVYPSFIQMRKYELLAIHNKLMTGGIKKIRRIGQTTEFDQIKEYVAGDDIRTINWKATARRDKLMVNKYQDEKSQPVYCLLDMGRNMKMPFEQMALLDYAINASLVISNIAHIKSDKPGLISFTNKIHTHIKAERRNSQMKRILEALYNQETNYNESDFSKLYMHVKNQVTQRSLLLLFTNFESLSSLKRQLKYLRQLAKNHLLVVIFFENTELRKLLDKNADNTFEIYYKTIAEKFELEKRLITKELAACGIQSVYTSPQNLSVNTINKYLELKARGLV